MGFFKKKQEIFGLDIGSSAVKAVQPEGAGRADLPLASKDRSPQRRRRIVGPADSRSKSPFASADPTGRFACPPAREMRLTGGGQVAPGEAAPHRRDVPALRPADADPEAARRLNVIV